jgi:hypothetical protein
VNKKRLLIALAVVAVMLVGGITAGTALQINQPVSATIKVESLGNSPTFNLIDNPSTTTAGGKAGIPQADDTYLMDFGPGGAGVTFGRNQEVRVGSSSDPIFTLQNNYAKDLAVRFVSAVNLNETTLIGDGGVPTNHNGFYVQFPSASTPVIGVKVAASKIISQGAHWIPAGESRSYYLWYAVHNVDAGAQPAQSFTLPLKLRASESMSPPMDWAVANLIPNDVLFDDANEVVYHKLADGSEVVAIPFAGFDYQAWLESWITD